MTAPQPDEVFIKDNLQRARKLWRYLLTRWLLITIICGLCAALSLIYAIYRKPVYTAECTFVLEEKGKSAAGLGQYSALASLAGLDAGSSGLFEGDNIFELYKSRLMLTKTLLSREAYSGQNQLLIEKYLEITHIRDSWKNNPGLKNIRFDIPREQFTVVHDSVIKFIVKDLNKNLLTVDKRDKKLGLISVKMRATDQKFAKAFTDQIVQNVNSFYIQTKNKGNLTNVSLLQRQTDSIRRILNFSLGAAAAATDATPNPNPNLQVLRVPAQKKSIDIQSNSAMYAEVVKNLEVAKATLQRETPLIQVIDEPLLPLDSDAISKRSAVVTGAFIGFVISMIIVGMSLISKYLKRMSSRHD
ncbi:Wzz/FepE/Etk N-terminal domain-containing protein [Hufsiella ginkgonis]|uniref:Lipopolysaccharide biosynthesis protein n=1 Tax=Hufsiella ginkgonis TaxID=2695274 RepID=A0A7K1Y0X8_9SPHI|nr:Wzz/FepE/Etk N-terminal domain-containing protein [Hufsiella ginkgonis]MXV16689.1 lipopolysaccharide biosynthesis protein [Hufsiella ginkgonis]